MYGSYITGLYLPSSDIDLSVNLMDECKQTVPGGIETGASCIVGDPLSTLATELISQRISGRNQLNLIYSASIPIIKMVDNKGMTVDISFGTHDAVENSKLITTYLEDNQHGRPLILLIKQLLFQFDLNVTYSGGLGSYIIVVLVMFYIKVLFSLSLSLPLSLSPHSPIAASPSPLPHISPFYM